ncbi:hypothetical protein LCGC14_1212310 [marine sediment metagenome]|uniref:Uncharacterized protein n=1 Tax=marine sediment metagenome TaxID=412755 RepID=A0A0F9NW07_9ZZZZ
MHIQLSYRLIVRDRHGHTLHCSPDMPAHSFVQAYVQGLRALFNQAAEANVRDTSNALWSIRNPNTASTQPFRLTFPAASDVGGILIGTGVTAVTMADWKLDVKIAHGVGGGQMDYAATVIGAFSQAGGDAELTVSRLFTNSSGGQITIGETGVVCLWITTLGAGKDFLIIRDVLPAPVDVEDAQTVTVVYTVKVSV